MVLIDVQFRLRQSLSAAVASVLVWAFESYCTIASGGPTHLQSEGSGNFFHLASRISDTGKGSTESKLENSAIHLQSEPKQVNCSSLNDKKTKKKKQKTQSIKY